MTEIERMAEELFDRLNFSMFDAEKKEFVKALRRVAEKAVERCEDRAKDWRHKNVYESPTNYKKKLTWDKGNEAEECVKAIRTWAGLEGGK